MAWHDSRLYRIRSDVFGFDFAVGTQNQTMICILLLICYWCAGLCVRAKSHRLVRRRKKQILFPLHGYKHKRTRWVKSTSLNGTNESINFICRHRYENFTHSYVWPIFFSFIFHPMKKKRKNWMVDAKWLNTISDYYCYCYFYSCRMFTVDLFIPFVRCDKKPLERNLWNWAKHSLNTKIQYDLFVV